METTLLAFSWARRPNFPSPVTYEFNIKDVNGQTSKKSFIVGAPLYHRRKRSIPQLRVIDGGITAYYDDVTASRAQELMTKFLENYITGDLYVIGGLNGFSRYDISLKVSNAMGGSSVDLVSVQTPAGGKTWNSVYWFENKELNRCDI